MKYYFAIFFTSVVLGSCMSVIVTSVWPNAGDELQFGAIMVAIAIVLVMAWAA
jgi:hypothetical protein